MDCVTAKNRKKNMKYIKYLVAVLFLGVTISSCGPQEPVGTVGQTTVQFKETLVKSGIGGGYVYVPISIFGANADAMNTADVTLSVKVDPNYVSSDAAAYIAKEDLTGELDENGKPLADIRVTSYDMVFVNNYKIAEEDKAKPFSKDIAVEVMILNTDPEIMEFKLVLETSNTTIGAVNECIVRLEKGPADRLCGEWWANFDGTIDILGGSPDYTGSWKTQMMYDMASSMLWFSEPVIGLPFILNFNNDTSALTYPTFEVVDAYDASAMQYICQWAFIIQDGYFTLPEEKEFECQYDNVNYTYIKSEQLKEWGAGHAVLVLNAGGNIESILGFFHNEAIVGLNLTRVKPAGKAPALAPSQEYAQPEVFTEITKEQSDALLKEILAKRGTLKVF